MTAGGQGCDWTPGVAAGGMHPALLDPWEAAAGWGEGTVLALLTATEGPAYRELGAAMAIGADGRCAGAITSGCVEADLVLHAAEVRGSGRVKRLRYGKGSPFFDMKLPCGGGIEVTLLPLGDRAALAQVARARNERRPVALRVAPSGRLSVQPFRRTGPGSEGFTVGFLPFLRLVSFGAGAEALVFAGMAARLGYDHLLLSHDPATLASAQAQGITARWLERLESLRDGERAGIDARTAVTLFYHDHDYEPRILQAVLDSPAFYIGAQGSRVAQATRLGRLRDMGLSEAALARLRGPIGLIPSTRDPQSLAISVLAEITACAAQAEAALTAAPLTAG